MLAVVNQRSANRGSRLPRIPRCGCFVPRRWLAFASVTPAGKTRTIMLTDTAEIHRPEDNFITEEPFYQPVGDEITCSKAAYQKPPSGAAEDPRAAVRRGSWKLVAPAASADHLVSCRRSDHLDLVGLVSGEAGGP